MRKCAAIGSRERADDGAVWLVVTARASLCRRRSSPSASRVNKEQRDQRGPLSLSPSLGHLLRALLKLSVTFR